MTTQLIKCTCKSSFQDETYGQNVRVGNCTAQSQYRCTVCGTVSGTKTTATAKAPVVAAATTAEPAKTSAPNKKKSGGNSGGKDIKKEKPGKKSLKGTKR
jgi:hypothetical protein